MKQHVRHVSIYSCKWVVTSNAKKNESLCKVRGKGSSVELWEKQNLIATLYYAAVVLQCILYILQAEGNDCAISFNGIYERIFEPNECAVICFQTTLLKNQRPQPKDSACDRCRNFGSKVFVGFNWFSL